MADDFSELRVLAADLSEAPAKAQPLIKKALQKTAFDIKRDWRKRANRTGLRKYSADIDYEVKTPAGLIEVEIGPTIGDSGSFGLVEDGGGMFVLGRSMLRVILCATMSKTSSRALRSPCSTRRGRPSNEG